MIFPVKTHFERMQKKIKSIVFWFAILFIAITVFSLTFGQLVPVEIADYKLSQNFYDIIMLGFPMAILLTLFGTLKKNHSKSRNWAYVGLTLCTSILSFCIMVNLIFTVGFGYWITNATIYRHKTENKVIKDQLYDLGALGYGRARIVELKPILKYWVLPTEVDTTKIDQSQWKRVDEPGDRKFP
jgi:hypothetical protein